MSSCTERGRRSKGAFGADESGQSSVEAAFLLPVFLTVVLLMVQPAIVLYDKMVMNAAVAEGCRLMATLPSSQEEYCEDFIRRRLGAVPQHDCFHVHTVDECSWEIGIEGDEGSDTVTVSIANRLRPLPLLDIASVLLGLTDDEGCLSIRVEASMPAQPAWVGVAEGGSPAAWVGSWRE